MMWRDLSDDARATIGELCDDYGSHLYDYCLTELSPADAELAVAGALLSAHARAKLMPDQSRLRPWLYGLARAHRGAVAGPASTGTWSRPGKMPDLLPEALITLPGPQRELLDLSVRHGLTHDEIAAIFGVGAGLVESMVDEAADGLEKWFAAVIAARTSEGCVRLAALVSAWARAPGRRTRTQISHHIPACAACRAAPRTLGAARLLRQLPLAAAPGTLRDWLGRARPMPDVRGLWRMDGFPFQPHALQDPVPPPTSPVSGPTTGTGESSWPAAGAAAAGQERTTSPPPKHSRADPAPKPSRVAPFPPPVRPARTVPLGSPVPAESARAAPVASVASSAVLYEEVTSEEEHRWEEFWRNRPDEADPEARITFRSVAKVGLLIGIAILLAALAWSAVHARQRSSVVSQPGPAVTLDLGDHTV
ncbi:sigma factor-like helix-turn-helix DNA-binding protein [Nonomuraea sp. NPDC005983]|uniref:RNA polymerase sigma factor n=1 Tax=Nonomuraea sp. NPDC005983 TaxID=3155595 RepID=UPI0033A89250